MQWLREHMRDRVSRAASIDSDNLLSFSGARAASDSTTPTLELVSEAAETIRTIQERATQSEARAASLAQQAIEKLRLAETRIQSAETARRVAEENFRGANERLAEAASRITAGEAELARADERIKAAEARALTAERAFDQLEQAIRVQLINLSKSMSTRSAHAA